MASSWHDFRFRLPPSTRKSHNNALPTIRYRFPSSQPHHHAKPPHRVSNSSKQPGTLSHIKKPSISEFTSLKIIQWPAEKVCSWTRHTLRRHCRADHLARHRQDWRKDRWQGRRRRRQEPEESLGQSRTSGTSARQESDAYYCRALFIRVVRS